MTTHDTPPAGRSGDTTPPVPTPDDTAPDDSTPDGADGVDGREAFWDLAEPWLIRPEVTRSTMMGFPCLRVRGQFFASTDRDTGDLLVKLPADRVEALIDAGTARSFAPAGRRFREWAAVPPALVDSWEDLLDEAHSFVSSLPPTPPKKKRARRGTAG